MQDCFPTRKQKFSSIAFPVKEPYLVTIWAGVAEKVRETKTGNGFSGGPLFFSWISFSMQPAQKTLDSFAAVTDNYSNSRFKY